MTSTEAPVVLILGAGRNIGQHTAQHFEAKGYRVALVARNINTDDSTETRLHIQCDLSDPNALHDVFSRVNAAFGVPSVVIYNAYGLTLTSPHDIFSPTTEQFTRDLNINTTSPYVAAQLAVRGFETLPASAARTFLYTGNALNTIAVPQFFTLGIGKAATAHMIEAAAVAYREKGFKFYYVDERKPDGTSGPDIDGAAHAQLFAELAESKDQGPWQQTFVKGEGYKAFLVGEGKI
ncbi:SDR family NAD(P)-dependent oxidoreductase [Aspergillus saccharolyticus JOP 1030-1]|uniref:Putative short chain type dehydrogenase n=1 Tax=Aspergillus saccharolyticus JOP 1030-1 TaxID=1450539 RepID=A0A318ZR98_9EURO|nr:putative short chain type dehydrogenase [Aspergillus saccharolyticus JOP 1030-1]PYH49587.1 putative short chain type dehydrogenase [Aspergillus saccharolyticus JOP 1030-1]